MGVIGYIIIAFILGLVIRTIFLNHTEIGKKDDKAGIKIFEIVITIIIGGIALLFIKPFLESILNLTK
jgi:ABC-type uncharacterized transport system permease subunit